MFSARKSLVQAAALPYVETVDGLRVALITSRRRNRWIVPKGWPENDRLLWQVAALEAAEEAGIVGKISHAAIGSYRYEKMLKQGYPMPCTVFVFPLLAIEQRLQWKERGQRQIKWYSPKKAAAKASDQGLSVILSQLAAAPESVSNFASNINWDEPIGTDQTYAR